ncbi:hypothetical protein ACQP00_45035 [Dactylosporangium sp. CS-047395]|uniref:hypothetical protein n=1 Tax=Dactylosporangium sp. CS-047395 TaxID=3239936 RepID=UPI003D9036AC
MVSALSGFEQLSGDEWQDLCVRVLHEHHGGGQLIEVPDDDLGDGGLEAYSLDGCIYQCYAPENEPLDTGTRYRKQRSKMTADVGKFIRNKAKIAKVLPPGYQAKLWILLVPLINSKRLNEHCHDQTVRLRAESLPYASHDIIVVGHTLRSFERAKNAVIERRLDRLHLPAPEMSNFGEIEDPLIEVMNSKLARTSTYSIADKRSRFVDRLLQNSVAAREHREWIHDNYSELGADLADRMTDLEARLEVQYPLDQPNPDRLLATVLTDTEREIINILNIRQSQGRVLAEGQVADWLMECPLDFP